MTDLGLALSCVPPTLAILLQKFSIPNDRSIASQASAAAAAHHLPAAAAVVIRETARGSLAVSSMAPTIIAYTTGAFALLATGAPGSKAYLEIYLVVIGVGAVGTLVAVALVLGQSTMDIAIGGIPLPIVHFGPTRATLIKWGVYLMNLILIALSVLVYEHIIGG